MNAKEILEKIKAVFNGTEIVPPVIPAPVPVVPAKLGSYPVDGGGAVYCAGDSIDIATAVYSDAAMTTPYPDGSYTVTGTDFTFTVAGGVVTVVAGTLMTATPAVLPVVPAGPTIPQFEAMEAKITALEAALAQANILAAKHEKILPDIFELAEKLIELPVADPRTLNEKQKEKFDKIKQRNEKVEQIAANLKKIKTQ